MRCNIIQNKHDSKTPNMPPTSLRILPIIAVVFLSSLLPDIFTAVFSPPARFSSLPSESAPSSFIRPSSRIIALHPQTDSPRSPYRKTAKKNHLCPSGASKTENTSSASAAASSAPAHPRASAHVSGFPAEFPPEAARAFHIFYKPTTAFCHSKKRPGNWNAK